ncbi:MAG: hypothetical protein R2807_10850 [Chitinophagales bacterium]
MPEISEIKGKPIPPQLQKLAKFTKLMDSQFKIPEHLSLLEFDPIIGLVPYLETW